MGADILNISNN